MARSSLWSPIALYRDPTFRSLPRILRHGQRSDRWCTVGWCRPRGSCNEALGIHSPGPLFAFSRRAKHIFVSSQSLHFAYNLSVHDVSNRFLQFEGVNRLFIRSQKMSSAAIQAAEVGQAAKRQRVGGTGSCSDVDSSKPASAAGGKSSGVGGGASAALAKPSIEDVLAAAAGGQGTRRTKALIAVCRPLPSHAYDLPCPAICMCTFSRPSRHGSLSSGGSFSREHRRLLLLLHLLLPQPPLCRYTCSTASPQQSLMFS